MFRRLIILTTCLAFILSTLGPIPKAEAQGLPGLPQPGTMVLLSPAYAPAHLMGMTIHPENALKLDFLIHQGDEALSPEQKKKEYIKLVKYFLASLTIPDKDQWVNLSPYERNRIITDDLGRTEMGRNLLEEDYLLKQITSSLMYPESGLGKIFWDEVYARAWKQYHTTRIPVDTFNKVWIVPDKATVYESKNTAYIIESHLKVMLEEDYLSLIKHQHHISSPTHTIASKIIKEIILPALEKEVNTGKNFAQLRQILSGMILATWYKKALRESLLGKIYADKNKTMGMIVESFQGKNTDNIDAIYQHYLKAFKKGVFNYIKEDEDKLTHQSIPRKYFAGGFTKWGDVQERVVDHLSGPLVDAAQAAWRGAALKVDRASIAMDMIEMHSKFRKKFAVENAKFSKTGHVSLKAYEVFKDFYLSLLTIVLKNQSNPSFRQSPEGQYLEKELVLIRTTLVKIYLNAFNHNTPASILQAFRDLWGSKLGIGLSVSVQEENAVRQSIDNMLLGPRTEAKVPKDIEQKIEETTRALRAAGGLRKVVEIIDQFEAYFDEKSIDKEAFIKDDGDFLDDFNNALKGQSIHVESNGAAGDRDRILIFQNVEHKIVSFGRNTVDLFYGRLVKRPGVISIFEYKINLPKKRIVINTEAFKTRINVVSQALRLDPSGSALRALCIEIYHRFYDLKALSILERDINLYLTLYSLEFLRLKGQYGNYLNLKTIIWISQLRDTRSGLYVLSCLLNVARLNNVESEFHRKILSGFTKEETKEGIAQFIKKEILDQTDPRQALRRLAEAYYEELTEGHGGEPFQLEDYKFETVPAVVKAIPKPIPRPDGSYRPAPEIQAPRNGERDSRKDFKRSKVIPSQPIPTIQGKLKSNGLAAELTSEQSAAIKRQLTEDYFNSGMMNQIIGEKRKALPQENAARSETLTTIIDDIAQDLHLVVSAAKMEGLLSEAIRENPRLNKNPQYLTIPDFRAYFRLIPAQRITPSRGAGRPVGKRRVKSSPSVSGEKAARSNEEPVNQPLKVLAPLPKPMNGGRAHYIEETIAKLERNGLYRGEMRELVLHFQGMPGFEHILAGLNDEHDEKIGGTVAELYRASLLESRGFKILAFNLDIKDGHGRPLTEIDIIAEKEGHLYFVEVKNHSGRYARGNRYLNPGSWFVGEFLDIKFKKLRQFIEDLPHASLQWQINQQMESPTAGGLFTRMAQQNRIRVLFCLSETVALSRTSIGAFRVFSSRDPESPVIHGWSRDQELYGEWQKDLRTIKGSLRTEGKKHNFSDENFDVDFGPYRLYRFEENLKTVPDNLFNGIMVSGNKIEYVLNLLCDVIKALHKMPVNGRDYQQLNGALNALHNYYTTDDTKPDVINDKKMFRTLYRMIGPHPWSGLLPDEVRYIVAYALKRDNQGRWRLVLPTLTFNPQLLEARNNVYNGSTEAIYGASFKFRSKNIFQYLQDKEQGILRGADTAMSVQGKEDMFQWDSNFNKGGIDLSSANLDMTIKRDGQGVPLPFGQQDMAQLSLIQGVFPEIIDIQPAADLPIFKMLGA